MGSPKERLTVDGESLLLRTVRVMRETAGAVVVVGRVGQDIEILPAGVEVLRDSYDDAGPVAGIEAGLRRLRTLCEAAMVTACDHPALQADLLRELAREFADRRAAALIVEHDGRTHPLPGVYRTELADAARDFLLRGERAAVTFARECQAFVIPSESFRSVDPTLASFLNVNEPAEFERFLANPSDKNNKPPFVPPW